MYRLLGGAACLQVRRVRFVGAADMFFGLLANGDGGARMEGK